MKVHLQQHGGRVSYEIEDKIYIDACLCMCNYADYIIAGMYCKTYIGQRPIDYNNTRWVSDNPDMYFDVADKRAYGVININGETTETYVSFNWWTGVTFYGMNALIGTTEAQGEVVDVINASEYLFGGQCKYQKDKVIITIIRNDKDFLHDSVKTITFLREDMDSAMNDKG